MQRKPRKRFDKNRVNPSSINPLLWQKEAISTAMVECLGGTVLCFTLVMVVICLGFFDKEASSQTLFVRFHELIILGAFLFYCVSFIRRFIIFLKFRKIQFSNEQAVSVNCRKILFLGHPESKHSEGILAVILKDESGNKFYYVYPEKGEPDFAKKYMREQYLGSVELVCYRDTNIVKRLPPLK